MDAEATKLFEDILEAVVYEDAGTTDRFMYIWTEKWKPLRERIEAYLKRTKDQESR